MPTVDEEPTTISAVHQDVLLTHILTKIDGPTLASASCASSLLHSLSTEQNLWRDICTSTWPSTNHPRIQRLISSSNGGPRSFFSDSFPLLVPPSDSDPLLHSPNLRSSPSELISAVDIHYKDQLIFSKVEETETLSGWFRCSPFRIDLLDQKEIIRTSIKFTTDTCQDLADHLKLSWIIVDPTIGRTRSANISSCRAVSVQQHWLTGEIEMKFVTVLAGGDRGRSTEFVQSGIIVTCGRSGSGEVHVREVSLQMEDMDGINLIGKESLGFLHKGMVMGRRKKSRGGGDEAKERYEEYLRNKEERKQSRVRREGRLDTICLYLGLSIFAAFCIFGVLSSC